MIEIIDEKYIIDTDLSDFRSEEETINGVMQQAVSGHQNEHDHFTPLEYNPEDYPFQRADCIGMIGRAATADTFKGLAPLIFPAFNDVVDRTIDEREDLLNHCADVLERDDLHVLTDHRDVVGVAVGSSLIAASLYTSGKVSHDHITTSIAVSTMLKNTAILGLPAENLLVDVFSTTMFVVPSSNPQNKLQLPANYSKNFNNASQAHTPERTKNDLTAVAPSGTRDIRVHRSLRPGHPKPGYYVGPPSNGTIEKYMTNAYCLDMGIDLSKESDGVYIGEIWTPKGSSAARLAIMEHIANGISETTGVKSYFVPERDKFNELKKHLKEQS